MKNKLFFIGVVLASLLAATSYYYKARSERSGIHAYQVSADLPFVLEQFKKNWYWLVAEGSTFDPEYSFTHLTPTGMAYQSNKVTVKLYKIDDKPVGFIAYYMKNFYQGFIWFLVVKDEFRKQGISYKLLNFALDDLKNRGASSAWLITRTSNIGAQGLYKKAGFKEVWQDGGFVKFEKNFKTTSF